MSERTLLLTGFPALRASQLALSVRDAEPSAHVRALVHPERVEEATARAAELNLGERFEISLADPAAIDFGLDRSEYQRLAATVDVVHAAYSMVEGFAGDALAERVNVGAARELVEFGRSAERLQKLVFYSSVFVSGQRSGRVFEDELEAKQSFRTPVERTLALAERMLRRSNAPWLVLRSGHLLGDTERGQVEHFSAPYPLLEWILRAPPDIDLPLPHAVEARLALTPVDYLARFGVFAASDAPARSTFHVLDPALPSLGQFLSWAAAGSGRRFELALKPPSFTRALLGASAARWLPQGPRDVSDVLRSNAEYDMRNADALLARGAPACKATPEYLDRLIEHVRERIEHGQLPSPRRHQAPFLVS